MRPNYIARRGRSAIVGTGKQGLNDLIAAAVFFVGTHLAISSTQLRPQLISLVGATGYRLLYSLVAIVAIIWLVAAYNRSESEAIWFGGPGASHIAMALMPIAILFVVTGLSGPNPTAVGQSPDPDAAEPARGILRVTRHPVMWGIGIWSILHIFANGDLASVVFFGAFTVLSLAGAQVLDARRGRENAPGWGVFVQSTSFVPFAAVIQGRQRVVLSEIGWARLIASIGIYAVLLLGHEWLSGVALIG